jgi:hypothetical protein
VAQHWTGVTALQVQSPEIKFQSQQPKKEQKERKKEISLKHIIVEGRMCMFSYLIFLCLCFIFLTQYLFFQFFSF